MLKRRARIQKYISNLKKKQLKKHNLQKHSILEHKIEIGDQQAKVEHQELMNEDGQQQQRIEEEIRERPCWADEDNGEIEEEITLDQRNKFRKINFGTAESTNVEEYERKVGKFYQARFKKVNWAQGDENVEEKDINDYLNQDIYYSDKKPAVKTIKFNAKTTEKHQSIVSGLDWHNNVMFTCGLDHKVKIWHFQPNETNPQLKLKQQKDIYIKDLPLSNCFYREGSLLVGTLRKNLAIIDTQKWVPSFITSSFLKDHKTYQNFRSSALSGHSAIFSNHKISLLDKNNIFMGNLQANEPVQDVCFNGLTSIFAVSADSVYEWDVRKMEIVNMERKYLGFTSICTTINSVNIGARLGTVYIYPPSNYSQAVENTNLLTHITQIKSNTNGDMCLAMSKWKSNALRVIDSLSGRAIGQWPSVKTKIGLPICGGFNHADYFGVGASSGHISVYGFDSEMI